MSGFTPATLEERPQIEAFLDARLPRAMFPRANLADHGMMGGHRHATRFWLRRQDGALTDVLGRTEGGLVMPACPTQPWPEAAQVLAGRKIAGLIGPAEECRPLRRALGLGAAPVQLDRDEPHFVVNLADVPVFEGPGGLVPIGEAPRAQVLGWIADYDVETLGATREAARAQAAATLDHYAERASHVVLMAGGAPLAMTGFNAALPQIVQIGGVYTPPALRGRGHARRALALHLEQARARGVGQATLFAAGPPAIRVYEALGFGRIGTWTMLLLAPPVEAACA